MPDRMPGGADPYGVGMDRVRYVPPDCSRADREALKRLGYEVREIDELSNADDRLRAAQTTGLDGWR